jgi:hypothetical protein
MNENVYAQTAPQPEKKHSGVSSAAIICLILGAIIFFTGLILYYNTDTDKYLKLKDYNETFNASDVTKLDLDIHWAKLNITQSSDNNIHVKATDVPEEFSADIKSSTFSTTFGERRGFRKSLYTFLDRSYSFDDAVVEIQLPEKQYQSFYLDIGAGDTALTDIDCDIFELNCGAGKLECNNINCTSGDIDCGAGEVIINNIKCKNKLIVDGGTGKINIDGTLGGIDLDQGVGEFLFTGTINGDIDADGGVGEMRFDLTNPSSDFGKNGKYSIDIDTGIGSSSVSYDQ